MRVVLVGAGLAARHLAYLLTSVEDLLELPNVALAKPQPELDFYPTESGKQKAQWKRETRGRMLK